MEIPPHEAPKDEKIEFALERFKEYLVFTHPSRVEAGILMEHINDPEKDFSETIQNPIAFGLVKAIMDERNRLEELYYTPTERSSIFLGLLYDTADELGIEVKEAIAPDTPEDFL